MALLTFTVTWEPTWEATTIVEDPGNTYLNGRTEPHQVELQRARACAQDSVGVGVETVVTCEEFDELA